jgi:hypothetical protein
MQNGDKTNRVGAMRAIAFAIAIMALFSGSVYAQETWGSIRGTVTDATGGAVLNARVELSGGASGKSVATTDNTGTFHFAQVAAGTGYVVTVTAPGFRTVKMGSVSVDLGKASNLDVKVEVGQVSETVEVSGSVVLIDTQGSSSATTVDKAFFDLLPKGRSFADLINIAPGARSESKSGGYQVDGASGSENVYYLDGMDVTGIQQGTLSTQNSIPNEQVQQVEVKNGVMEAQYGGALGGVINAVVRSGSNSFHGQAGGYFNNGGMQARPRPSLILDPNDDSKILYVQNPVDSYKTWNPVMSLGGPLAKNKLFFFSSYAPVVTTADRTVNFTTGQKGTYNQRTAQQYLTNKVDFAPFSKIHVSGAWIWNPNRVTGALPSNAGTDAYSNNWAGLGNRTSGDILHGQIDYLATSKLIISFRGGYDVTNYNNNYGITAVTGIYYSNSNKGIAGVPASLQNAAGWINQPTSATLFDRYIRKTYNADVSYVGNWHGQHDLKGGWQLGQVSNDVNNNTYPNGYYRFYWNLSYNCALTCSGKQTGTYGYYRYRILGTIGAASSNQHAMYLQDNWRIAKHLTLNLGLRTEREFVPSYASGSGVSSKAITFDWNQKLAPRIGAAWDVTGNGKQKLYASWGIFYDVMKYELPRGSFGGDVWKEFFYSLDDPNLVTTLNAKGFVSMSSPADASKLPGKFFEMNDLRIPSNDPSQNLIDPNLKPVQTRVFDLGYDYMFGSTLVASIRYSDRRLARTIEDTGTETPNGEQYYIANPGEGITTGAAWTKNWGPGVPTPPKPVRNYDAVEFRLDKRFSSNYQFALSYTLSRLYGNYSGLASSDENGRTSPDVNRYYDQPWIGLQQNGKYPSGLLATDRPNTLKLFGAYTLHSKVGQTTFSPHMNAYSGTPITTEAPLQTSDPSFPFGRGDLGRTPFYFNTDFSVVHQFLPFKNHEQVRFRVELSIFNLFNSATATDLYKTIEHQNDIGSTGLTFPSYASIFQGWDTRALMKAQGIRQDPEYGLPISFQGPRTLRLQVMFFF